jgi:phosphoribosylanthranilate isomerase
MTGKPVIKAIRVKDAGDIASSAAYNGSAALILFDAKAPETLAGALPGGNGVAFDWSLLGAEGQAGFVLSGGLNPGNVAQAIRITGAPIVDVASGVELAPGVKDIGLIRKFIEAAKGAR